MAGYKFVAIGAAQQLKAALYRFEPARKGRQAYWDGDGAVAEHGDVAPPYADRSWWSGRYALTELTMADRKGNRKVINDVVAKVTQTKNIVKTALAGGKGTVKEYISDGDYEIELQVGIAATDGGVIVDEYPEQGMRELMYFLTLSERIEVRSVFLDLFDITGMVVTEYKLTQNTQSNYQSLEIKALSDEDYNVVSKVY